MTPHPSTRSRLSAPSPARLQRRRFGALVLLIAALLGWGTVGSHAAAAGTGFSLGGPLPGLGSGKIWSVAVEPSQPSRIIAGTDAGIYLSQDSGASWTQVLSGMRVWTVGFDIRNSTNAFAGTDGHGVYASSDAETTWTPASTGLPNLDVRSLAFGLDGIAAGTNAGVALSPNGLDWHDGGLDTYSIAAVAVAANYPTFTVVAGADSGNLAQGYLFSSTGGGSGWEVLQSGLPSGAVVSSISAGQIDTAVPKRPLVVTTSQGAYRSGDGGITWTPATGPAQATTLTTATFGPLDPTLVYAGADAGGSTGGDFYRSTDGGLTYHKADTGLPLGSKNVESISVANTTPPEVVVAIDTPAGGSHIFIESDSAAPTPPKLIAESPGASVPTAVATPPPTPTPTPRAAKATPKPPPPSGIQRFAQAAFHWPTPLVYEVFFVLLALYVYIRWRQRYYVEGPP